MTATLEQALATFVCLPNDGLEWTGTCWAWIELDDRRCDKPTPDGVLCKRHLYIARRRAQEATA